MASTGLTDPSSCGSGKMYRDCCLFKDMEEIRGKRRSSPGSRLKEAMEGRAFSSIQEAQETFYRVAKMTLLSMIFVDCLLLKCIVCFVIPSEKKGLLGLTLD